MTRSLIAACLARRALVLIGFVAFLGIGTGAFYALNIEAYPDPAPPIIEIIAQYPGQSPEEVERYVTIPIEIAIASTPGLKYIRSNSVYALGFIRLQFEYGRDYHFVRQQALNRLKDVELPQNVQPVISPAGTISEIYRYQLVGPPEHGRDGAAHPAGLGGGAAPAPRAGRLRRAGAWRQDQGIPGRDRSQPDAGLRAHAAADHQLDLGQQLQCRRPHYFHRRAVGERARPRRADAR